MNRYGAVALHAVSLIREGETPPEAWRSAARSEFPGKAASQQKPCPRGAFLGLCEEGLVIGVPPGTYTTSINNKAYAVKAIEILRRDPGASSRGASHLWMTVMDGDYKTPNHQMNVVLALWDARLIVGS